jgi:hypothetical protein
MAQDDGKSRGLSFTTTPPMPPMRPAALTPSPAPAAPPAAAAVPASNATAIAPPPGIDPMVANFTPDMPQELPAASRTRMHRCAADWQKMKVTGAATDKTWLAFARLCLVGAAKE